MEETFKGYRYAYWKRSNCDQTAILMRRRESLPAAQTVAGDYGQERVPAPAVIVAGNGEDIKNNKAKPIPCNFNTNISLQRKIGPFRPKIESKPLAILRPALSARTPKGVSHSVRGRRPRLPGSWGRPARRGGCRPQSLPPLPQGEGMG